MHIKERPLAAGSKASALWRFELIWKIEINAPINTAIIITIIAIIIIIIIMTLHTDLLQAKAKTLDNNYTFENNMNVNHNYI